LASLPETSRAANSEPVLFQRTWPRPSAATKLFFHILTTSSSSSTRTRESRNWTDNSSSPLLLLLFSLRQEVHINIFKLQILPLNFLTELLRSDKLTCSLPKPCSILKRNACLPAFFSSHNLILCTKSLKTLTVAPLHNFPKGLSFLPHKTHLFPLMKKFKSCRNQARNLNFDFSNWRHSQSRVCRWMHRVELCAARPNSALFSTRNCFSQSHWEL
jgi:hypothetical protein